MVSGGVRKPVLPPTTQAVAESFGLESAEWNRIVEVFGRAPTEIESIIFSVLWSEEFCRKSSTELARAINPALPVAGEKVRGRTLGVVAVPDGQKLTLAVTDASQLGGGDLELATSAVLDAAMDAIVHRGGTPVLLGEFTSLGSPEAAKEHVRFRQIANGLGRYANSAGVPLLGSRTSFHLGTSIQPVLATCCVGLLPASLPKRPAPTPGSLLLYLGRSTGLDGISRDSQGSSSAGQKPLPPVVDLHLGKQLREAIGDGIREGLFTDTAPLGVGALSGALFELAVRLSRGIRFELDKVPAVAANFTPRALLTSRTPERALVVVPRDNHRNVSDHFVAHGFQPVTIGELIDSDYVEVSWHHKDCAIIPYRFAIESFIEKRYELSKNPPMLLREFSPAEAAKAKKKGGGKKREGDWSALRTAVADDQSATAGVPPAGENLEDSWLDLLTSANISSRQRLYERFDSSLGGNTVFGLADNAAITRVRKTDALHEQGIAFAVGGNTLFANHEPYIGTVLSVAEAMQRLAATGAQPVGLGYALQFGDPKELDVVFQMAEMTRGLQVACETWKIPVLSNEISHLRRRDGELSAPTPSIFLLGIHENIRAACGHVFRERGDIVFVLGETKNDLGCSEYCKYFHKRLIGAIPDIDFERHEKICGVVKQLVNSGHLQSAHSIATGGLAVALTECCLGREKPIGATLNFKQLSPHKDLASEILLFAETPSRFLVSCKPEKEAQVRQLLKDAAVLISAEGTVGGTTIEIANFSISIAATLRIWSGGFNQLLGNRQIAA